MENELHLFWAIDGKIGHSGGCWCMPRSNQAFGHGDPKETKYWWSKATTMIVPNEIPSQFENWEQRA